MAPRLSAILPTGSEAEGLGSGSVGLQANLPLSWAVHRSVVTHWNAGVTWLPRAKAFSVGGQALRRSLTSFNLGASVIAPTQAPVQLVFESVVSFAEEFEPDGSTGRASAVTLNPGARAAVNWGSLQIVPGVAFPFVRSDGRTESDLFLYLSFEHPFARR